MFTVVWTYVGNYGVRLVLAKSAAEALDKVTGHFSEDFQAKANCYVFRGEPELEKHPSLELRGGIYAEKQIRGSEPMR